MAVRINAIIRVLLAATIVVISYWNIWAFLQSVAQLPLRNSDQLVRQETRYEGARAALLTIGYRNGPIGFITNRDLQGHRLNEGDQWRWHQGQYAMVPWTLLRDRKALNGPSFDTDPPFVIGDFWDGQPQDIPLDLVKLYDSGDGLILYQKRSVP